MFSSETYNGLFRELYTSVQEAQGILDREWVNVAMVKWHVLGDVELNSTEDEARYSRAYITELAAQFREEEFILRIQLKGYGVQFQVGFSTDVSESCIWITPFIKFTEDMSDVRFVALQVDPEDPIDPVDPEDPVDPVGCRSSHSNGNTRFISR